MRSPYMSARAGRGISSTMRLIAEMSDWEISTLKDEPGSSHLYERVRISRLRSVINDVFTRLLNADPHLYLCNTYHVCEPKPISGTSNRITLRKVPAAATV